MANKRINDVMNDGKKWIKSFCGCDPLKQVIRQFLLQNQEDLFKCSSAAIQKSNNIRHLFYKPSSGGSGGVKIPHHLLCASSVNKIEREIGKLDSDGDFERGTNQRFLECKISYEETIKGLREWVDEEETKEGSGKRSTNNKNDCDDGDMVLVSGIGRSEGNEWLSSWKEDKFGNLWLSMHVYPMSREVIRWLVEQKGWFGYANKFGSCHNQLYQIEIAVAKMVSRVSTTARQEVNLDSESNFNGPVGFSENSLQEYRKILVAQSISRILKKIGHQVDTGSFTCIPVVVADEDKENQKRDRIGANTILVVGSAKEEKGVESAERGSPQAVLRVDVGGVVATATDPIGVQDSLSKRLAEIKVISESRRGSACDKNEDQSSWITSLDNLTRATLHWDLLSRSLENDIRLLSLEETQMNHNALVIMYNYSRILSILRKFGEKVEAGDYHPIIDKVPSFASMDEVDFTLICDKEEELILLQLLMEWPRVMESSVNLVRLQSPNLLAISKFLLALAKAFNTFYFQVVVLVPSNSPHNFGAMLARIYLLKAVCLVFEDCLDILQVSHASSSS